MNFLAHLYLSPANPGIIFGNFIADAVKGKDFSRYPAEVQQGIELHRFIDYTTDKHPVFIRACERLRPFTGRFAAVSVDIIFDHFLAANWIKYSNVPLTDFASHCYHLVEEWQEWLPPKAARTFYYMKLNNWLINYADKAFLERVFKGMSGRVSRGELMLNSFDALNGNYSLLQEDFSEFFPELCEAVANYKF